MRKEVFLARLELVVACFGPPKIPNCLVNGLFCNQKWVKNGSKKSFSKNDLTPFGVPKGVKGAHFEPIASHLAPPKSQNALKMGCFATKNGSKMGQKCVFLKMTLDHLGCTNK